MTQPKALRLADRLETFLEIETNNQAAAELRRLHEQNQTLIEALKIAAILGNSMGSRAAQETLIKQGLLQKGDTP